MSAAPLFSALLLAVPSDSASPLRTHPGEQRTAIPVATVRPIAALRDTVNGSCLPTGEKELVAAV